MSKFPETKRCDMPAKSLPPCDLEWGHMGTAHSNAGDVFYVPGPLAARHKGRQKVVDRRRKAASFEVAKGMKPWRP